MATWAGTRCGASARIDTSPSPRFDVGDDALTSYFHDQGYVVVRGAAEAHEVAHITDMLWEFLEAETPLRRSDATTWSFPNELGYADLGIINDLGFNHSRCCWEARQLESVRDAFCQIWFDDPGLESQEELIVSFDGGNIFLPWHGGRDALVPGAKNHKTSEGWFHVDQGRAKGSELMGVQGLLALTKATRATGGLLVVPGSHKRHAELMACQEHDGDFVCVGNGDPIDTTMSRLVVCEAGDLVLWDSRVVHCNTCALETPDVAQHPLDQLLRAAVYVCMCPASFCSREVAAFRTRAFCQRQGTNHWPHDPSPVGGARRGSRSSKRNADVSDEQLASEANKVGVRPENMGLITGRGAGPS